MAILKACKRCRLAHGRRHIIRSAIPRVTACMPIPTIPARCARILSPAASPDRTARIFEADGLGPGFQVTPYCCTDASVQPGNVFLGGASYAPAIGMLA